LQAAAQGLQLAAILVAAVGPAAFLAATGLASALGAAKPASRSDTPAAASPPAPIVSPRIAALEIRECFIDVIMSSVDWAREPPAAISGPVATAPLAPSYDNEAGLWGELPVTSAHFIVRRKLRVPASIALPLRTSSSKALVSIAET
jgi:hypothetical protein